MNMGLKFSKKGFNVGLVKHFQHFGISMGLNFKKHGIDMGMDFEFGDALPYPILGLGKLPPGQFTDLITG